MEKDPYKYFRVEAAELAGNLSKAILRLERDGNDTGQLAQILRLAHTLKGAARVVKQRDIADIAHTMEEALSPFRDGGAAVPSQTAGALLAMLDSIQAHIDNLTPASPRETGSPKPEDAPPTTFRPEMAELDALLRNAAEAQASLAGIKGHLGALRTLGQRINLLTQTRGGARRPEESGDPGNRIQSIGADMRNAFVGLERALMTGTDQLGRDLRQLCVAAERLQLVPAEAMFNSLERVARDAAQSLGKQVEFVGLGGDLRLDAQLLAIAQNALVQMVRNAVAHGIEGGDERLAAGKSAMGKLTVKVRRRGRQIAFTCADDGKGIEVTAVRRAAEAKGLMDSRKRDLDTEDVLGLLLCGGISTAGVVTAVSGRGIGLDIVREAAALLGGEVKVRTNAGKGTAMELLVPMTTASLPALQVEAAGQTVTIPLDAIKRITRIAPDDIAGTAEGKTAFCDGQAVPLASLSAILDSRAGTQAHSRALPVVFIESGDSLAAITVDRLFGVVNAVVKPLPPFTPGLKLVAGSTLDAWGNPQIMLYPDALVAAARGVHETADGTQPVPSVLVVDDSLTTRMLEQSILETAGYAVQTAQSGEEALKKARKSRFGLLLVDVEMPGMDGFTFIERVRADARLCDIPAILVTSRASPEDRRRGEEVGAQGYIVKSEFDQAAFLASVRQMAVTP